MKVLIINPILTTAEHGVIRRRPSVIDTMISNFAMGFCDEGHQVTIVTQDDFRPTGHEEYPYEILFFKSRCPRVFSPALLPWPMGLKKWLKAHADEYDLVVASENFSIATLVAAWVCKRKLVIWQEMSLHQHKFFKIPSKFWYNVVNRLWMRDVLVVPRSVAAREFVKPYCLHVTDEIVDNGVNGRMLYPSDERDDAFACLSQLVPRKRIDLIIKRFSKLVVVPGYTHYLLHVMGDGEMAGALRQQVKDLGLEQNVIFHGFMRHAEMAGILRRCVALLVNTSKDLNMVSVTEAIVSGTPVVMNTMPISAPMVQSRRLGIARDDWDETDLIKAIQHYDEFHRACIEARDTLTSQAGARRMISLYQAHSHAPEKPALSTPK